MPEVERELAADHRDPAQEPAAGLFVDDGDESVADLDLERVDVHHLDDLLRAELLGLRLAPRAATRASLAARSPAGA